MKMKKCFACGSKIKLAELADEDGVEYEAWKCPKCGEEALDLKQAEKYARKLEEVQRVTFTQWGKAIGMRIPARMARRLGIRPRQKARIMQGKRWIKIVPEPAGH